MPAGMPIKSLSSSPGSVLDSRKAVLEAHVVGSLPPTGETWIEFPVFGFSLLESQLQVMRRMSQCVLSLCVSLPLKRKKKRKGDQHSPNLRLSLSILSTLSK